MKRLACMAALLTLLSPALSNGADMSIDASTVVRVEERRSPGFSKQLIVPATQFLGLDAENLATKGLSMHFYGWGRLDLADESAESNTPRKTDGNFTYGYLQYSFDKGNANVKAGRLFVYEGVAAEQIDGVYARTDLNKGFTVAAFGGIPVKLDRASSTKGKYIGGGRLGYRYGGILDVGVSGLNEGDSPSPSGKDKRQLVGGDIWLSPFKMIELSGKSSYNGTTKEIAEHAYLISLRPISGLTAAASYNEVRLKDYFTFTNTPASLFNPDTTDKFKSHGFNATYRFASLPIPTEISLDYKHYKRGSGNSDRFGGEIRLTPAERFNTGVSYSRTAATNSITSFHEARAFAMYNVGKYSANLDMIANFYDQKIYDKKKAYEITGGCGYLVAPSLKVSGEASYADNPAYDSDVRGIIRLTYSFNNKKGAAQ